MQETRFDISITIDENKTKINIDTSGNSLILLYAGLRLKREIDEIIDQIMDEMKTPPTETAETADNMKPNPNGVKPVEDDG